MDYAINKKYDNAFVLTHIGLSDNITTIPFIRYLRTIYDKVYTTCKKSNLKNVKSFYSDDNNIILIENKPDEEISPLNNIDIFNNYSYLKDIYLMGYHNLNNNKFNYIPFNFYDVVLCPYRIFWNYFKIDLPKYSKLLFNYLKSKYDGSYIFIHNTSSTGQVFDYNFIKRKLNLSKNNILFINPCINMYDKYDYYYEIADQFINYQLADYVDIIINANYIILGDSSFYCLAMQLPIKTNNCFVISRGYSYEYVYTEEFGYNDKMIQKRFISLMDDKKKIYFMTFGGGNQQFHDAVERIKNQAKEFDIFDKIYGFTDLDLKNDLIFWKEHGKFILSNPRFYGYAIWKSYLIRKVMNEINDGDLLLYLDCGSELNIKGKDRFLKYIDMVYQNDSLATRLSNFEKSWTKTDLFNFMNTSIEDKESGQIQSGFIFLKKSQLNLNLLDEWYNLQTINNYHFVDDSPSLGPNDNSFIENRHDQSCFSLLMKKYERFTIPDETYFYPNWNMGIYYPIWALRNKTGKTFIIY
jgi:hypothetical protein